MIIKSLFSSSSGNCTIIENDKTRIMIDAGVSFKQIEETYGSKITKLDAIFLTHSHTDHSSGAGVVARKFECPLYLPEKTFEERKKLFDNCKTKFITGGTITKVSTFDIKAFSTRHDVGESVGYVITEPKTKKMFGYVTDTGVITKSMKVALTGIHALFIEADYDTEGLEKCAEYDDYLKDRIRSPLGHLSNQKAIDYLKSVDLNNLEFIIFGHLSKHTNSPEILSGHLKDNFSKDENKKFHIASQKLELELK